MAREIIISIYLLFFKILFNVFKLFPLRKKTTFILSFVDNGWHVYNQLLKEGYSGEIVFLESRKLNLNNIVKNNEKVYRFETYHIFDTFFSIYHIATSTHIIIDNYYGFLSEVEFKEEATCIQVWHAAGAIKKFGLKDPSIKGRSENAKRRFRNVYEKFDHVVVGTEKMAEIYYSAFGVDEKKILKTGIPRTDYFYNEIAETEVKRKLYNDYPQLMNKKVILYAPTYREKDLSHFNLKIDLENMLGNLADNYILILKLHPEIENNNKIPEQLGKKVLDLSGEYKVNDLLFITDYLITDYSSIPFEFSLFEKPMIFYAHDLDAYEKERGFWQVYESFVPGPIVKDTDGIINAIKRNDFDIMQIKAFKNVWNEYSLGESSLNLIRKIYNKNDFY
ncbi:CDP-glycerol glycerophosphotransferase family protein [Cytobacillus kochii]|uniref:CDP-glycerol glycerophosphotransferase family protein n=1 Tax=Cytobacillus kochii TaxID=859143 RepID=UPI001CD639CB|nr:CDP-glycerol glycerophosphotransferase family protein [Cytobacillus kochii]MCA1026836.1 CDP-glycerol glycerophosphotransferase family protein [Cytobacillus kochii]